MSLRRIALLVFVVALALVPVLTPASSEFLITQANYIGLYTLVVIGPLTPRRNTRPVRSPPATESEASAFVRVVKAAVDVIVPTRSPPATEMAPKVAAVTLPFKPPP